MGATRVLLNVTDGQYYALNEVGGLVWDLCDGRRSMAEVVAEVGQQYDGEPAEVRADVLLLAQELLTAGLLSAGE